MQCTTTEPTCTRRDGRMCLTDAVVLTASARTIRHVTHSSSLHGEQGKWHKNYQAYSPLYGQAAYAPVVEARRPSAEKDQSPACSQTSRPRQAQPVSAKQQHLGKTYTTRQPMPPLLLSTVIMLPNGHKLIRTRHTNFTNDLESRRTAGSVRASYARSGAG